MQETGLKFISIFMAGLACASLIMSLPNLSDSSEIQSLQSAFFKRSPQSVDDIFNLLGKVESDLKDEKVFNRTTAIDYITNLTEAAYNLGTNELYPQTDDERFRFRQNNQEWIDRLFRIQLKLRSKMIEFHQQMPLSEAEVMAFRNGNMYLSYAQDFVLMQRSDFEDVSAKPKLFATKYPVTQRNPEIAYQQLTPGDLILVRGGSFVSATIARSGDYLSNFSHLAVVIQDPDGNIEVAEALMEEGLIKYSLDQYLNLERLSRAVVLRHQDPEIAKKAGLAGWKIYQRDRKKLFDMLMDPHNHDRIFCGEFGLMAFKEGSEGKVKLPTFPMTFKKALNGNSFYRGLGNSVVQGFAPDDVFFEPGFDVVMAHRDISLLKKSWAFDVALSTIFEYMNDRFDYVTRSKTSALAYFLNFIKADLGINIKSIPPGVSVEFLKLIMEHKRLTTTLQQYLMKQMEASPKPLAYKELRGRAVEFLEQNSEKYFVPYKSPKTSSIKSCRGLFQGN